MHINTLLGFVVIICFLFIFIYFSPDSRKQKLVLPHCVLNKLKSKATKKNPVSIISSTQNIHHSCGYSQRWLDDVESKVST